ncbi:hypothetical protein [Thioalkalivibrio sp.]|uniref:hypothetical protein n=1 Tax=Thioalkalivibrio sp. TaxID=2093813 RepID=UPI0039765FC6
MEKMEFFPFIINRINKHLEMTGGLLTALTPGTAEKPAPENPIGQGLASYAPRPTSASHVAPVADAQA